MQHTTFLALIVLSARVCVIIMTQIMWFFVDGFETSSSGLSFCLYKLARNPDIQIKLQRELDEALERHGSVTYQMLQELPYIDNVISEALRMYSTLSMLNRVCGKPYRIPDVVIDKGCRVIIPLYSIHHDPKYYPKPFKFDPDHFLEENEKSRPAYTFLPFGDGPRICIGMRFAKMQMRLALVALFSQFNVKLNPKTPVPLTIACGEFLTKTRDEILIDLCSRNDFFITLKVSTRCDEVMVENSVLPVGWTEIMLTITLLLLTYVYYTWTSAYAYWRKRNVPYLKPTFPFGNVTDVFLLKKNFRDTWLRLYRELGNNQFGGVFSLKSPVLIVKDPKLIKLMLTKDFSHFMDHGFTSNIDHEPLLNNIFFMEGDIWKQMRTKLSPTFTSGKMKMMFSILYDCSRGLETCLKNIFQNKGTFEAKELMSRYTFDTILTSFFGLQATAIENGDSELYQVCGRLFEKSLMRSIANTLFLSASDWYSRFKMHIFGYDACKTFAQVIRETIEFREKHSVMRNDFLDLLIKLKNNISIDDKDLYYALNNNATTEKIDNTGKSEGKNILKVEDVMTQILGFFIGGFETTSSGLSFCLYELARYPDVQIKLQRELDEALERHGSVTYQMLQELPYIDNVISETLRMYGTLSMLNRICGKPYRIPDTDVFIEKGCKVLIPSYAIHHDPKYYPEPFKFDPDHFLEENVKSRPAYTFLPFGEGPRLCIGMRFAKMQMRLALVALFSQFNVKLNPKTPVPLTIACGEFLTRTRDEIWIDLCSRNDFSITY